MIAVVDWFVTGIYCDCRCRLVCEGKYTVIAVADCMACEGNYTVTVLPEQLPAKSRRLVLSRQLRTPTTESPGCATVPNSLVRREFFRAFFLFIV